MLRTVIDDGGPKEPTAYVQHDADVEALLESLPRRARRDLRGGWYVTVQMDAWDAAHCYGYDAHTAFER